MQTSRTRAPHYATFQTHILWTLAITNLNSVDNSTFIVPIIPIFLTSSISIQFLKFHALDSRSALRFLFFFSFELQLVAGLWYFVLGLVFMPSIYFPRYVLERHIGIYKWNRKANVINCLSYHRNMKCYLK